MKLRPDEICARVRTLKSRDGERNARMDDIKSIREGRWDEVAPGLFPPDWPKSVAANMIDVAAKDTASVIAPLPSFNCSAGNNATDKARKFADKKTQVANYYVDCSNLQVQMHPGANRLLSYGFMAFMVEPDFKKKMPKVLVDDNFKAHYQLDRFGDETLFYCRTFTRNLDELILEFPEAAPQLMAKKIYRQERGVRDQMVELVRWYDRDQDGLYVIDGAIQLQAVDNPISRCRAQVVEMPKLGECVRGEYDDVVWVQIARAMAQLYALQAMKESVHAPISMPDDVQEFAMGPGAILRSQSPEKIGRVNLQIPNGVFAESQNLTNELRVGSRYPEGRSGQIDASIITGQGVEALMGTFSTQTKTAQLLLARGLRTVIGICFELDEALWPNEIKTVRGNDAGSPYETTYRPAKDIAGDYTCDVTYGLTAGLDPNRALVFILQAMTAGILSDDSAMRQLPVDIAVEDEKKKIAIELQRKSLVQAVAGYAQAIPMMATQGMDPAQPVQQIAEMIRLLQKGEAIEEAAVAVFAPPPPPPEAASAAPAGPGGMPPGGPAAPEQGMPGEAPPEQGAGGAQDLLMSLAGMTQRGQPNLQSTVSRRQPI